MFDAVLERTRAELVEEPFCLLPEMQFAWIAARRLTLPSSRFDVHAALSVIVGEPGAGKSFLVRQAMARAQHPRLRRGAFGIFSPTDAESLTRLEDWSALTVPTVQVDGIVLEDLDRWDSLEELSDRLAHLIDIWMHQGIRMAVTLSQSPGSVPAMTSRLVSRLHGGLLVRVAQLSAESRYVFLKWVAESHHLSLSDDVLFWLMEQSSGTVNSLRDQVQRLVQAYSPPARITDLSEIQRLFAETTEPRLSLSTIAHEVASEFGISTQELRTATRVQSYRIPRQCAMWLAHEVGGWPMTKIGQYFGRRTHAAVSYNCRKLLEDAAATPSLRQQLEHLRTRLNKHLWSDCG